MSSLVIAMAENECAAPLPAVSTPQCLPVHSAAPIWLRMSVNPTLVRAARDHARLVLAEEGIADEGLAEEVRLIVSEVVTNAMRAAERYARERGYRWPWYERPVALRVVCRRRWVHILVIDPDPTEPDLPPELHELLDEVGGRGLGIVDHVAALRWFRPNDYGQTAHIVVARPGVTLTPTDVDMLKRRAIL
jgi:anti-sigma regulatory factor (Ser/Thr protein kinase)